MYFLIIALVSIPLCYAYIDIQDPIQKLLNPTANVLCNKSWHFLLFYHLFELAYVITVKEIDGLLNFISKQFSKSFAHFPWCALEISDIQVISL